MGHLIYLSSPTVWDNFMWFAWAGLVTKTCLHYSGISDMRVPSWLKGTEGLAPWTGRFVIIKIFSVFEEGDWYNRKIWKKEIRKLSYLQLFLIIIIPFTISWHIFCHWTQSFMSAAWIHLQSFFCSCHFHII